MIFLKTKKTRRNTQKMKPSGCANESKHRNGRQSSVGGKQLAVSTKAKLRLQTAN